MSSTAPPPSEDAGKLRFDPTTVGDSGLRRSGGWIHDEFLKDLRGSRGMRTFREMADNDWVCGAILFAIDTLIRGVEWSVTPPDESVEAREAATFVEEVLSDMVTPFDSVLAEITTMFTFGFAPLEIVWKKRRAGLDDRGAPISKFDDGRIGVRALALRAQETIDRWDIDDADGTILGLWQQSEARPATYLPAPKILLFRTTAAKNNPIGRSVLRTAYRAWYFKTRVEEIEAIGAERDLAGLPMVRIPQSLMQPDADPQDRAVFQAYQRLVTQVRRDQQEGIILPSARDASGNYMFDFQLLSSGGERAFDTNKVLTRWDRAIATAVLADFIFLGQQAVGSFALSSDKTALFGAAIQAYLKTSIAQTLNNELLPRLWHLNALDPATMPTLTPGQIEEAGIAEVCQLITTMTGAGAPMFPDRELENHLRARAGLPLAPEDDGGMGPTGVRSGLAEAIEGPHEDAT